MLSLYRKRQLKRKLKNKILKQTPKEVNQVVYSLLANFEENQLENLFLALDSRGGDCIWCFPPVTPLCGEDSDRCLLAICNAYRWPDVQSLNQLRKMPFCHHQHICLNPFHYSKLIDTPFTSIDMFSEDYNIRDEEIMETEMGLTTMSPITSEDDDVIPSPRTPYSDLTSYPLMTRSRSNVWCSLAYWEGRSRVGRLFPVKDDFVNVFDFLPKGDGFCLAAIASSTPESRKTKKNIGHGVTIGIDALFHVWLFNRGDYAVFVHSAVLEPANTRGPRVHKLPAGHCMRIFDFDLAPKLARLRSHVGPYRPSSAKLSFVKGWGGPTYRRQCITTCPCWLEILFNTKLLKYS